MNKLIKNKTNSELKQMIANPDLLTDVERKQAISEFFKRIKEEAYDRGFAAGEKHGYDRAKKEEWDRKLLDNPLKC